MFWMQKMVIFIFCVFKVLQSICVNLSVLNQASSLRKYFVLVFSSYVIEKNKPCSLAAMIFDGSQIFGGIM